MRHYGYSASGYVIFLVFLSIILFVCSQPAGAVHKGAGPLVCGSCHTMHNSQGGSSASPDNLGGTTGGSIVLLRGNISTRADMHKLCLQCHGVGGSMWDVAHPPHGQRAPIVHSGGLLNWDQTKDFGQIGAGGDFFKELDSSFDLTIAGSQTALGYGHSVGLATLIPGNPNSSKLILTCTTCHNPHGTDTPLPNPYDHYTGTNIYRNLWAAMGTVTVESGDTCGVCHSFTSGVDQQGNGRLHEMKSWIGGITGKFSDGGNYTPVVVNGVPVWPVYKDNPTIAANNNVYDGIKGPNDHATRPSGIAGWCAKCHLFFHEVRVPSNATGEDWRRHPVAAVIKDSDVSGAGVDTIDWAHYNSIPDGFKLPAANTDTALDQEFYYADADNEDKVFCLTCHFAHGGPYYDALRWDYVTNVVQGNQSGNTIPSNVGCQQCHNR